MDQVETRLKPAPDMVNSPPHYNKGRIEVIEFIEDQQLSFHSGSAVKYVCRAGIKDPSKHIEDLQKAIWYLRREVELIQSGLEDRHPCRSNEMKK
jgi:Protein of unknwon function (DUF3310)